MATRSSQADAGGAGALRAPEPRRILFFDGVCGLCNRFVDLVLRADRKRRLRFAPLQGATARELLPRPPDDPAGWSVVYLDERGVHRESDAALEVCRGLGGFWSVLALARFVPRLIRDPIYRGIARHRYRLFGRRDACRLPAEHERERFLP